MRFVMSLSDTNLQPLFSILLYHPDLSENKQYKSEFDVATDLLFNQAIKIVSIFEAVFVAITLQMH